MACRDPQLPSGPPDFRDEFTDTLNWAPYADERVAFEIREGAMVMTAFNADSYDGWVVSWPQLTDFYLQAQFAVGPCSGLDHYGLLARAALVNEVFVGYLLGVSCDGRFNLRIWDGESFRVLLDWAPHPAIKTGEGAVNELGLMAVGTQLNLYANGVRLAQISDATYGAGSFGLFVGSAATPNLEVRVDKVEYWILP